MKTDINPLVGAPPREVPLPRAPLVQVIAQVRFPPILSVAEQAKVARFQEAIAATYPVLREETTQTISVGATASIENQKAWRFSDVATNWRVTLTANFLSLETNAYSNRAEFLYRFELLLEVLAKNFNPAQLDRFGIRYIDRIVGDDLNDIAQLVEAPVRGLVGTNAEASAALSISESVFINDEGQVIARWGKLPPNATIDPSALVPLNESSWILDLDMFSIEPEPFDSKKIIQLAESYAMRLYSVFRWAVSDEFLKRFGGVV